MRSVTLKSHVGEDGVLHLQVPVGVKNATVEVVVVFQTMAPAEPLDERGWPVGFFEETAGAWAGAHPRLFAEVSACRTWASSLITAGVRLIVSEIADYELRRELIRVRKTAGLRRLDQFKRDYGYLPLTTQTMLQVAQFWAQLRQIGLPTALSDALDGNVILAAQAAILQALGDDVIIATTNVRHLERLVPTERWDRITA